MKHIVTSGCSFTDASNCCDYTTHKMISEDYDEDMPINALDLNGYQMVYWGSTGGNWPTAANGFSVQIGIVEGPDVDCNGDCFGSAEEDECGECDNDSSNDCVQDCAGEWGGDSVNDECGICGGDNSSCDDCAGVPNGDNWVSDCGCVPASNSGDDCDDECGVPNGDGS